MNRGCDNYKVGDIVKIRRDLKCGHEYGDGNDRWTYEQNMYWAVESANFVGKIISIHRFFNGSEGYRLDCVPGRPFFNDAMIEGYAEEFNSADVLAFLGLQKRQGGINMKYKVGDRVAIKRDLQPDEFMAGGYLVTEEMCKAATVNDYVGTIVEVISECNSYRLDIQRYPWWEDWMFEGLATDFKFCSKEVLAFLEELQI